MSQYFQYDVSTGDGPSEVICAGWCDVDPVLAVATRNNRLSFVDEEGHDVHDAITRGSSCSAIAWKPDTNYLVTGWEDGCISALNTTDWAVTEDKTVHRAPITCIKWSNNGTRLVTTDKAGTVGVWRIDSRGRTVPMCAHRKSGAITHVAFAGALAPPEVPEGSSPEAAAAAAEAAQITSFFFGGVAGLVFYADDLGNCTDVGSNLSASIDVMEYYAEKDRLVIVTSALQMTQVQLSPDGRLTTLQKVQLSMRGESGIQQVAWVGEGLLATSCPDEAYIRVWNLSSDENYMISLASADKSIPRSDRISDISFNQQKSVLAAGTAGGRVVMWRRLSSSSGSNADWEPLKPLSVAGPVHEICWAAAARGLLAVWLEDSICILNETELHRKVVGRVAAVQVASNEVAVERQGMGAVPLRAGFAIRGLDVTENNVVVWNGRAVEVYSINDEGLHAVSGFTSPATAIGIHRQSIFAAVSNTVQVLNFQGTVTHTITFSDAEGEPKHLNTNGRFLALATSTGLIQTLDVSRSVPKLLSSGRFEESRSGESFGEITGIRCNSDGTRVSILAAQRITEKTRVPDSRVFVYSSDLDAVTYHDLGPKRTPTAHYWDIAEPKLLAVQTDAVHRVESESSKPATTDGPEGKGEGDDAEEQVSAEVEEFEREVTTFFATPEDGIIVQDVVPADHPLEALLGLQVPHLFFITKASEASTANGVATRPLRDFIGLEDADDATKQALLDFSYHLSIGNMDSAYKAVKLIANAAVWENMAQMCVKSKRLDVAEVCLGNMGHSRGAKAVREAKAEPELEARVAMVGIQLGLLSDAARLYQSCGRYDLLNKLYQSSGDWEKALAVAEKHDRMHLKTTHYEYARHLESIGDVPAAIHHYEAAKAHRIEVPRMLFNLRSLDELEAYVDRQEDTELLRWWAQYCESKGDFERAVASYDRAGDALSLVRVYCLNKDFATAAELVIESGDRSAAYHLARQHEANGSYKDAIFFFERAGRYNHAVRLAKEAGLDTELAALALQASAPVMLDAATYFEEKGDFNKAVQLYQKGGNIPRALDICFKGELFEDLRAIADDLGEDTSPEVLSQCAEFFMKHEQYDKAVHLLVEGKRYNEAIEMCALHKVKVSEDMAEKMTLPKPADDDELGKKARTELLRKVARLCKKQGSYHLATKKYTQAGDKLKAMKSLLKSGDTEKIIFFAGVSRNRDIYVLAANYLQNLDWHNDGEVMKSIISFYTKARAYEQLSGFYDACAAVEIDEYRNYEKALGALKESAKYAGKIRGPEKESRLLSLTQRISTVERFVQARKMTKSDPAEMVKMCQQLLDQRDVEASIRVGDVFALLIEFYYTQRNMEQAYHLIENMRQRGIILSPFLDAEIINTVYRAMGVEPAEEEADDGVDEEIDEALSDEESVE